MKFKKQIGIIVSCVLILAVVFVTVSYIGDKNKSAANKDKSNAVETGLKEDGNSDLAKDTSNDKNPASDNTANNTNDEMDTVEKDNESKVSEGIKEGYYNVKESDTLYSIARTYMPNSEPTKVVEAIKERNNLSDNVISKGQKLIISYEVALGNGNDTSKDETADSSEHTKHVKHVVKAGDTLYSIAEQYMSSMNVMDAIDSIKAHNNIGEANVIKVSETICIPAVEQ